MAARAALRGGAGLVTVAAPASAQRILAGGLQEAMTAALPEQDGALCPESFERIERLADRCDALCVGPGATRDTGAQSLMERVLREVHLPAVLDADGLSVLTAHPSLLADRRADTVLTPHPGECARLLGVGTDDVQMDRIAAVRQAAERFGAVVVLKGGRTLVADGRTGRAADSIPVSLNTAGNPGLATAGSGDTLTGIIGALLGQGMDAADAARLGVYLHARSGDIAAARLGQAGMVAGDITESLPLALREFEEVA
jgi:NAD(P)H-hydrate epimerase